MDIYDDEISRIIVVFIISPIICYKSLIYKDLFLLILGIFLFIYLLKLIYKFYKRRKIVNSNIKSKEDINNFLKNNKNTNIEKNININIKKKQKKI